MKFHNPFIINFFRKANTIFLFFSLDERFSESFLLSFIKHAITKLLQMFRYDKHSSDLVLRKGFKYSCDVPKRISNIINPIQRRVIC